MLLETLLLSPCFLLGKTTLRDSQTTISVDKKLLSDDEVLLFFDIDDQTKNHACEIKDGNNHRRKLRELFWGKKEGHSLCDFLVFYAKGNKRVFCFVELKDNKKDFPKATEQVISTCKAFKEKLPDEFKSKFDAKAFICCSTGSLPQEYRDSLRGLNEQFSDFKHDGESKDFLGFLRGENNEFQKKGKNKKKGKR